ncbi:hypothetical protein [Pseudonocardia acaciae]|uniref:hypothetical protein n=1 Tax=Pseudonocardia acaciae TaxID=551276 RepID=UPI0004903389|nr:hypothetical protein [Pseudonocardia acaciae]
MSVPRLDVVLAVVGALRADGLVAAVGGSGLLVALGLAEVAHDWDVTVDAPTSSVAAALRRGGLDFRDGTERGGVYASDARYVIDGGDHDIDVLVNFALRGPGGVVRLPTVVTGCWRGLPLADPEVWARAYRLLGRAAKATALERREPLTS